MMSCVELNCNKNLFDWFFWSQLSVLIPNSFFESLQKKLRMLNLTSFWNLSSTLWITHNTNTQNFPWIIVWVSFRFEKEENPPNKPSHTILSQLLNLVWIELFNLLNRWLFSMKFSIWRVTLKPLIHLTCLNQFPGKWFQRKSRSFCLLNDTQIQRRKKKKKKLCKSMLGFIQNDRVVLWMNTTNRKQSKIKLWVFKNLQIFFCELCQFNSICRFLRTFR
jgi:hypothetical protein